MKTNSIPVTQVTVETPNDGPAVYFSRQEHSAREWVGKVDRYETESFPAGTRFVKADVMDYFSNTQQADKFIAGQIAVYEEAGKLVLNSYKSVKGRPVLELIEASVV
jgi:hypothetical protein